MGKSFNSGGGGISPKIDVTITPNPTGEQQAFAHVNMYGQYTSAAQLPNSKEVVLSGGNFILAGTTDHIQYGFTNKVSKVRSDYSLEPYATLTYARGAHGSAALGDDSVIVASGRLTSGDGALTNTAERVFPDGTVTSAPTVGANASYNWGASLGDGSCVIKSTTANRFFEDGTQTYIFTPTGGMQGAPFFDGGLIFPTNNNYVIRMQLDGTLTVLNAPTGVTHTYMCAPFGDGSVAVYGLMSGISQDCVYMVSPSGISTMIAQGTAGVGTYGIVPAVFRRMGDDVVLGKVNSASDAGINFMKRFTSAGTVHDFAPLSARRVPQYTSNINENLLYVGAGNAAATFMPVVDVFGAANKRSVRVPALNRYQFAEHATLQPEAPEDRIIFVDAPNVGVFKPKKGTITI